jgi:cytochrome c oxidase subunit IV
MAAEHAAKHSGVRGYLVVFVGLLLLTAVTYLTAKIDLGDWNVVLALFIASVKGTMVVLVFMHLREHALVTRAYVVLGFLFVALLASLTLSDVATRLPYTNPSGMVFEEPSEKAAHGNTFSPARAGPQEREMPPE